MAKDYGGRSGRGGNGMRVVVAAFATVSVVALAAFAWREHQRQAAADARIVAFWKVEGTPCTPITAAELAAAPRPPKKRVEFDAARISRSYGDGACREFEGGMTKAVGGELVCQFSTPSWLEVTTASGVSSFAAGPGPATVTIGEGGVRCVQAAHLQLGMELP